MLGAEQMVRLSDVYNIGVCHQFLALIDRNEGRLDEAIQHAHETLHCYEQVQSPHAGKMRAWLRGLSEQA